MNESEWQLYKNNLIIINWFLILTVYIINVVKNINKK